jgi:plastocyanin
LTLALVGCGNSSDSADDPVAGSGGTAAGGHDHGGGTCSPSGTTLSVSAKDVAFDKTCLAAPADEAFTINFENKEAVPHSVVILKEHTSPDALFSGETITGPNKTAAYKVNALKAGNYHFHCSVHPSQMQGDFIVK